MRIDFPNDSRSFEAVKKRIRFWGYDQAIEITFFVDVGVLLQLQLILGASDGEESCLAAFDAVKDCIRDGGRAVLCAQR